MLRNAARQDSASWAVPRRSSLQVDANSPVSYACTTLVLGSHSHQEHHNNTVICQKLRTLTNSESMPGRCGSRKLTMMVRYGYTADAAVQRAALGIPAAALADRAPRPSRTPPARRRMLWLWLRGWWCAWGECGAECDTRAVLSRAGATPSLAPCSEAAAAAPARVSPAAYLWLVPAAGKEDCSKMAIRVEDQPRTPLQPRCRLLCSTLATCLRSVSAAGGAEIPAGSFWPREDNAH